MYDTLPTEAPDCYIATAAAKGHPAFVQSWSNGGLSINQQLQRLKAVEIALQVSMPKIHGWLRKYYDIYGRYCARRIKNPYVADLAYLTLKPIEWCGWILLSIIVPRIDTIWAQLNLETNS